MTQGSGRPPTTPVVRLDRDPVVVNKPTRAEMGSLLHEHAAGLHPMWSPTFQRRSAVMPACETCGAVLVGSDYEKIAKIKHRLQLCERCYKRLKYTQPTVAEQHDRDLQALIKEHKENTELLRSNVSELHTMHQQALMEVTKLQQRVMEMEMEPTLADHEVMTRRLIGDLGAAEWNLTDSDIQGNGLAYEVAKANERWEWIKVHYARLEIQMDTLNGGLASKE